MYRIAIRRPQAQPRIRPSGEAASILSIASRHAGVSGRVIGSPVLLCTHASVSPSIWSRVKLITSPNLAPHS